jgi:hypothetical protein
MIEIVFVVDESPEGGFTARAVGESIFTEAATLDELRANVRSAVECHFDEGQSPKKDSPVNGTSAPVFRLMSDS